MQSIRSVSGSAISELKDLLSFISDPMKMKASLEELDASLERTKQAEKDLFLKEQSISEQANQIKKIKEELELKEQAMSVKAKEISQKEASFGQRESDVARGENKLQEKEDSFEKYMAEEIAALESRKSQANEKAEQAEMLKAKSEALIKEFENKISKLKAITG